MPAPTEHTFESACCYYRDLLRSAPTAALEVRPGLIIYLRNDQLYYARVLSESCEMYDLAGQYRLSLSDWNSKCGHWNFHTGGEDKCECFADLCFVTLTGWNSNSFKDSLK